MMNKALLLICLFFMSGCDCDYEEKKPFDGLQIRLMKLQNEKLKKIADSLEVIAKNTEK